MTATETRPEAEAEPGANPFVAPAYAIRKVPFDALYSWLAGGWRDIARAARQPRLWRDLRRRHHRSLLIFRCRAAAEPSQLRAA